ncbi:MAG: FCD domain-containing protein [Rhodospirillales bacterium]|nr:FCD domain-containing protein [Rhodospirillales bacterium]
MVEIYRLDQTPSGEVGKREFLRQAVTNADALVDEITGSILEGRLFPGKFLGSERDISKAYGVSRNTAREALRSLVALGAVEIRHGVKGGATVASGNVKAIGETLAIQHRLSGVPEDEVLEVQSVLESLAAERAAIQATVTDIAKLESLIEEAELLTNDASAFSDSSFAFHMAVVEASYSQALMLQLRSLRYFIWPPNNKVPNPSVAMNVIRSHRKLLSLIKDRDSAGARDFMRSHIEHIRGQHRKLREAGHKEFKSCCQ